MLAENKQRVLLEETWICIFSVLDALTLGRACAVCMAWASNTEDAWKEHCIRAYPVTKKVKKIMEKHGRDLTWRSLYCKHYMAGLTWTQDSDEYFERTKFKLGIQIEVKGRLLPTVLLDLNMDPKNDFLVDCKLQESEMGSYSVPHEDDYPTLTMRVWLYDVKYFRMLELHGSGSCSNGVDNMFDEDLLSHWNINAENILPEGIFLDVVCRTSERDTENERMVTFSRIECEFWHDDDPQSRNSTYKESNGILKHLDLHATWRQF